MLNAKRWLVVLGAAAAMNGVLVGCGNPNNVVPVAPMGGVAGGVYGGCGYGSVYTQYGCLAQGSCPAGYGQYGTQCIYGNVGGGMYGGGYGYGNCPPGYIFYGNQCVAQNTGYPGQCPPGYYYTPGYGCR